MSKPEDKKLPSTTTGAMPPFISDKMSEDAGKGVSTDQADNQVPLLYILDAKSPQVDRNDAKYIEGAMPGSIWLRNYSDPIVDGNKGILFQPCYFSKDWVEWVMRAKGGGLVARHPWNNKTDFGQPEDAKQVPHPEQPKKMIWVLPNGNEVKETRYHSGYVILPGGAIPFVIPLSSTGHTVSRNWMFTMMSKRTPDDKIVPSWSCLYRLTTRQRQNAFGKWYNFEYKDEGYVATIEDYNRGKSLHEAFAAGVKVAATDEVVHEEVVDDGKM